jgi:hypothetical protein
MVLDLLPSWPVVGALIVIKGPDIARAAHLDVIDMAIPREDKEKRRAGSYVGLRDNARFRLGQRVFEPMKPLHWALMVERKKGGTKPPFS